MKWEKVKLPILLLIGLGLFYLLYHSTLPSLLKYVGSAVTLVGAIAGYWHKAAAEKNKAPALQTSLNADLASLITVVVGAIISMGSTHSDDVVKQKDEVTQQKKSTQQQKHFDDLAAEQKRREDQILQDTQRANDKLNLANKTMELAHRESRLAYRETQLARSEIQAARKDTTRNFTAEANRSIATLKSVVHQAQRAISPVRDVRIFYTIELPIQLPAMADYRSQLQQAVTRFQATGEDTIKSPDFDYKETFLGGKDKVLSKTVSIRLGSPLYPTDTNTLIRCLIQYRIIMYFWKSSGQANLYATDMKARTGLYPDCRFNTEAPMLLTPNKMDAPELTYSITTGRLFASYKNVIPDPDYYTFTTQAIETLPDMLGSTVYAFRGGTYHTGNTDVDTKLDSLIPHCPLRGISVSISSKPFMFRDEFMKHFQDQAHGDAVSFTFQSIFDMSRPANQKLMSEIRQEHGKHGNTAPSR